VHWQVPLGEPPAAGWPAVLMFQGSFFSAEITWIATDDLPFGAYYQTWVVKRLLDAGYAVITPEAKLDGGTFWDTNVPPYSINWESSEDHELMLLIFAGIEAGTFGPLDSERLFATGISSGGYMTSRMAVSYPGKFRALAIAAGSYATCSGPLCNVPDFDASHPPTLFLHGEVDLTVPLATAEEYYEKLLAAGVDAKLVTQPGEGHAWIPQSPDEVLAWFDGHP
jgi:dienelactone hydrolase